jgi:hypothetical protein
MFAIEMVGCDIVFGVEWLRILGPITMDFLELYMSFRRMGIPTCSKVSNKSLHIYSSPHHVEKLLKKGHSNIIAQFHVI